MTPEVTRLLLTNQINGFCLGYKGVTRGTVEKCLAALNANCLPIVPTKGTVGSHDFAQLRNVFNNDPELGFLRLDVLDSAIFTLKLWDPFENSKKSSLSRTDWRRKNVVTKDWNQRRKNNLG